MERWPKVSSAEDLHIPSYLWSHGIRHPVFTKFGDLLPPDVVNIGNAGSGHLSMESVVTEQQSVLDTAEEDEGNKATGLQCSEGIQATSPQCSEGNQATSPQCSEGNQATSPQCSEGNQATSPQCSEGNQATNPQCSEGNQATSPQCSEGNQATGPQRSAVKEGNQATHPQCSAGNQATHPQCSAGNQATVLPSSVRSTFSKGQRGLRVPSAAQDNSSVTSLQSLTSSLDHSRSIFYGNLNVRRAGIEGIQQWSNYMSPRPSYKDHFDAVDKLCEWSLRPNDGVDWKHSVFDPSEDSLLTEVNEGTVTNLQESEDVSDPQLSTYRTQLEIFLPEYASKETPFSRRIGHGNMVQREATLLDEGDDMALTTFERTENSVTMAKRTSEIVSKKLCQGDLTKLEKGHPARNHLSNDAVCDDGLVTFATVAVVDSESSDVNNVSMNLGDGQGNVAIGNVPQSYGYDGDSVELNNNYIQNESPLKKGLEYRISSKEEGITGEPRGRCAVPLGAADYSDAFKTDCRDTVGSKNHDSPCVSVYDRSPHEFDSSPQVAQIVPEYPGCPYKDTADGFKKVPGEDTVDGCPYKDTAGGFNKGPGEDTVDGCPYKDTVGGFNKGPGEDTVDGCPYKDTVGGFNKGPGEDTVDGCHYKDTVGGINKVILDGLCSKFCIIENSDFKVEGGSVTHEITELQVDSNDPLTAGSQETGPFQMSHSANYEPEREYREVQNASGEHNLQEIEIVTEVIVRDVGLVADVPGSITQGGLPDLGLPSTTSVDISPSQFEEGEGPHCDGVKGHLSDNQVITELSENHLDVNSQCHEEDNRGIEKIEVLERKPVEKCPNILRYIDETDREDLGLWADLDGDEFWIVPSDVIFEECQSSEDFNDTDDDRSIQYYDLCEHQPERFESLLFDFNAEGSVSSGLFNTIGSNDSLSVSSTDLCHISVTFPNNPPGGEIMEERKVESKKYIDEFAPKRTSPEISLGENIGEGAGEIEEAGGTIEAKVPASEDCSIGVPMEAEEEQRESNLEQDERKVLVWKSVPSMKEGPSEEQLSKSNSSSSQIKNLGRETLVHGWADSGDTLPGFCEGSLEPYSLPHGDGLRAGSADEQMDWSDNDGQRTHELMAKKVQFLDTSVSEMETELEMKVCKSGLPNLCFQSHEPNERVCPEHTKNPIRGQKFQKLSEVGELDHIITVGSMSSCSTNGLWWYDHMSKPSSNSSSSSSCQMLKRLRKYMSSGSIELPESSSRRTLLTQEGRASSSQGLCTWTSKIPRAKEVPGWQTQPDLIAQVTRPRRLLPRISVQQSMKRVSISSVSIAIHCNAESK